MRKFIITCLVLPLLVIKVAFLYRDDSHLKKTIYISKAVEPTYRVSVQVYPSYKVRLSAALSELNKDGTITPMFIAKTPTM